MSEHKHKKQNAESDSADQQQANPESGAEVINFPSSTDELSKLLAEKQELMNTLVRRQADFDNYRKRVDKERHADRHRGVESMIEHMLPVLDAFDRALSASHDPAYENYRKGFELIRKQLWESLSKQGLVRVDSVGQEFNPHMHHAIERVETSEYADGTVIGDMQPGYIFHEKVLRPAMVRVASAPEPHSAHASKRDN